MRQPDHVKQQLAELFSRTSADHDPAGALFAQLGQRLVDHVAPAAGQHVLDVAAGTGASLIPAARRVGREGGVVGVDVAPGMVQVLRAAIAAAGLGNARALAADAENLPFAGASFDVVLCGFGLFFFPHPPRALAEFRRVLRRGGVVGMSTFARSGSATIDGTWALIGEFAPVPAPAPDEQRFHDPERLGEALSRAGFDSVEVTLAPHQLVLADIDAWLAWLGSMEYREALERMDGPTLERFRAAAAAHFAALPAAPAIRIAMDALLTRARRP